MFKGSHLKNGKDLGTNILWVFITPTVDCLKEIINKIWVGHCQIFKILGELARNDPKGSLNS